MVIKIAFRNVFRQRRRTLLTMLTMFGGFTLASISIGWSDGTYSYTIDMFTRNRLGHIQVHGKGYLDRPSLYNSIEDYDSIGSIIQSLSGVQAWAPRIFAHGLASVGEKSSGVRIVGLDPVREVAATRFDRKVVDGDHLFGEESQEALVGRGLAEILRARVGDGVVLVSQAADGSIANDIYTISGMVESGDAMRDKTDLYISLYEAQELLSLENRAHEIAVVVADVAEVKPLAREIEQALGNPRFAVEPWQEFARSFYRAMKADREGMWISLLVIIIIVAVGVLNTVLMSVLERTREYGVLRALGTRPDQVFRLVLYEISIMAAGSIIIGAALSILANYLISVYGIPLPQPFTWGGVEFERMYSKITMRSLAIPAVTVLLSAVLVAVFPAIKAARTSPAKAMRTH